MQLEGLALRVVPVKSQSDRQFGIFGYGRVVDDRVYDNVMHKFKWGHFEKDKLFVDNSYLPSVNAQRMVMMRTAVDMLHKNDKAHAAEMAERKSFPNMNFPFDSDIIPTLSIMAQAGAWEQSKPYREQLVKNLKELMVFYNSMDPVNLSMGYQSGKTDAERAINDLIDLSKQNNDPAFENEVKNQLGAFIKTPQDVPQMQAPIQN